MKTVGITVAVEFDQLIEIYKAESQVKFCGVYRVFSIIENDFQMVFFETGPGKIQAAAGTQLLIEKYNPIFIVNMGTCGGLKEQYQKGDICVVKEVIDCDYDISMVCSVKPGQYMGLSSEKITLNKQLTHNLKYALEICLEEDNNYTLLHNYTGYQNKDNTIINKSGQVNGKVKVATCACQDRVIVGNNNRISVGEKWECQICDMELSAVAIVCLKNKVDLCSVKIISDSLDDGLFNMDHLNGVFMPFAALFYRGVKTMVNMI